jgi:predicted DNA-binding transcriptional regulator AlpA
MPEQTNSPSEIMRLVQAAHYIGMSPGFLRKATVERIRLGNRLAFRQSALDAFIQSRIEAPAAR